MVGTVVPQGFATVGVTEGDAEAVEAEAEADWDYEALSRDAYKAGKTSLAPKGLTEAWTAGWQHAKLSGRRGWRAV